MLVNGMLQKWGTGSGGEHEEVGKRKMGTKQTTGPRSSKDGYNKFNPGLSLILSNFRFSCLLKDM